MSIKLKNIMVIVFILVIVGFLHTSGIGYKIIDFFSNPGGTVGEMVPDVDINR